MAEQLGTSKGMSENSEAAQRRASFSLSEDLDSETIHELKKTVSDELQERKKSVVIDEPIPENALETNPSTPVHRAQEERVTREEVTNTNENNSSFITPSKEPITDAPSNPDKPTTSVEDQEATMTPSDPKSEAAVANAASFPPPVEHTSAKTDGTVPEEEAMPNSTSGAAAEPTSNSLSPGTTETDQLRAQGPSPDKTSNAHQQNQQMQPLDEVVESHQAVPEPVELTQALATEQSQKAQVNGHTETPTKRSTQTASRSKPLAVATNGTSHDAPTAMKTPSSSSSFPKSPKTPSSGSRKPTTPIKLSPHLIQATKASAARSDATKAPTNKTSRASLRSSIASNASTASTAKAPTRPGRVSEHLLRPTASSSARAGKADQPPTDLRASTSRKPVESTNDFRASTTRRSAPSAASKAAPPRKPAPPKAEEKKREAKAPGEGFLARMMRPTAASAGKSVGKDPKDGKK